MRHLDEHRDPAAARALVQAIRSLATRRWTLMEVCGGQTHSLLKHGIAEELADLVELIHGPGCPVCVTPAAAIDYAQRLALREGVTVASFEDMLRVPGSSRSLLDVQAEGGAVRPVYSPLDALELARKAACLAGQADRGGQPPEQIVFFAVGFETTAPATALAVRQAAAEGIGNFSLLVSHVRVLPAVEALAADPQRRLEALLGAGHVAAVTGTACYEPLAARHRLPIVVTGFEPVDLLRGIHAAVRQLESGEAAVENAYSRVVSREGSLAAQQLVDSVYEPCDLAWRGLSPLPGGGLQLRDAWRQFDAVDRFGDSTPEPAVSPSADTGGLVCRSGEVLTGRIKPHECELFGGACTPAQPLGALMVSSEGACAAYYRYGRSDARA